MSNQQNDPAEALRQIKAQWEGPSDWPLTDEQWAQLYAVPLLAVAECALELDAWLTRYRPWAMLHPDMVRLLKGQRGALERLGQREGEEDSVR